MRNIHDTTNFRALDPSLVRDLLEDLDRDKPPAKNWQALQHRSFAWLLGAALLSNIGTWMQNTAQAWFIYETTRSPLYLGLDTFLMLSPLFLLAFPSGTIVDRFDRRRVFLAASLAQIACTACAAMLFLTGRQTVWALLSLSFVAGIGQAFANVAYVALIPRLVPTRALPQATALNSLQLSLARMVGPLAAGGILLWLGPAACYAANSLSFMVLLVMALRVKERPPEAPTMDAFAKITRPLQPLRELSLWQALAQEVRQLRHYLKRRPGLIEVYALCFVVTFFGGCVPVLLPSHVRGVWNGAAWLYTVLLGLYGLGTVLGSLYIAQRPKPIGGGRRALYLTGVTSASLLAFALMPSPLMGAIAIIAIGGALIALLSQLTALVQFGLVDEVRGRVMSLFLVTFQSGYALGGLAVGAIATRMSTATTILACGVALAVVAVGGRWLDSRLSES
ncbi:MAG: MFS transporter [Chloracidobacterium sp.]